MQKLDWVKNLVRAEEQLETSGVIDLGIGFDNERSLAQETLQLLNQLKNDFVEASATFNEMKASPLGRIKIYGIAKTQADFMLFRNGFKMVFSLRQPGEISIRFNFLGPQIQPTAPQNSQGATALMEEHLLIAKKGPFGESIWTYKEQEIRIENVVRYHLTLFIRESST